MMIDRLEVEVSDHYTYRRPFYFIRPTWGDCTRIEVYLDFYVPFLLGFYPDIEHINWVKRAWGLEQSVSKPSHHPVIDFDGADFDPIPF